MVSSLPQQTQTYNITNSLNRTITATTTLVQPASTQSVTQSTTIVSTNNKHNHLSLLQHLNCFEHRVCDFASEYGNKHIATSDANFARFDSYLNAAPGNVYLQLPVFSDIYHHSAGIDSDADIRDHIYHFGRVLLHHLCPHYDNDHSFSHYPYTLPRATETDTATTTLSITQTTSYPYTLPQATQINTATSTLSVTQTSSYPYTITATGDARLTLDVVGGPSLASSCRSSQSAMVSGPTTSGASYYHRLAVVPGHLNNDDHRDFHFYYDSRYHGDQLIATPRDHHSPSHTDDFIRGHLHPKCYTNTNHVARSADADQPDYEHNCLFDFFSGHEPATTTSVSGITSIRPPSAMSRPTSAYPSTCYVTYTSVQPASTSYVTSTTTLTQTTTSISVQPASTIVSTYVTTLVSTQPASTQYITSTLPPQTSTYVSTYSTTQIVTYTSIQPASTAYITNTATATTTLPASTITNTATSTPPRATQTLTTVQTVTTSYPVTSYITTTQSASTLTSTVVSYSTTTYLTTIFGTTTRPASTVTATQTQTTTSSSTPSTIPITFDEFIATTYGEEVYIYGSLPQLGTMPAGIQMSAANYTSTSNLWFITINVTAGTSFTYSFYTVDLNSANADYGINEYDPSPSYPYVAPSSGSPTLTHVWPTNGTTATQTILSTSSSTIFENPSCVTTAANYANNQTYISNPGARLKVSCNMDTANNDLSSFARAR
ncbi:hypothetical protein EJ03DRAFT_369659 [Teratosphaeria nubilosa]|uniref:CBM20 domain-containing protein n=1 Tax=Teratosphaeria nubilosa TaxID=161662 RepID=A0A6G1LH76_9PEZI|nr:hypothetical protein EJ03DRAFT_369659 [Teratosphaeria nubilosa]